VFGVNKEMVHPDRQGEDQEHDAPAFCNTATKCRTKQSWPIAASETADARDSDQVRGTTASICEATRYDFCGEERPWLT
jgi:hypothetical protein